MKYFIIITTHVALFIRHKHRGGKDVVHTLFDNRRIFLQIKINCKLRLNLISLESLVDI